MWKVSLRDIMAPDFSILSNTYWNLSFLQQSCNFRISLIVVSTHHHGILYSKAYKNICHNCAKIELKRLQLKELEIHAGYNMSKRRSAKYKMYQAYLKLWTRF